MRTLPAAIGVLAAGALFLGCRTPTQITIDVSVTGLRCSDLKGMTISVGRPGQLEDKPAVVEIAGGEHCVDGHVGSLVVVPSGGKSDELAIKIVGGVNVPIGDCTKPDYKGCIVARRTLHFVPHESLDLPVALARECLDDPCDPQSTCIAGVCVSSTIEDASRCHGDGCGDRALAESQPRTDAGVDAVADTRPDVATTFDAAIDSTIEADTEVGPAVSPSCAGGLTCGSISCCESRLVTGSTSGTLPMGRGTGSEPDVCPSWGAGCFPDELPQHAANVSDFRLDTFEVTVGRFRRFYLGYPANKPKAGDGAHPKLGAPSGWDASWPLPTTRTELDAALTDPVCDPTYRTWTPAAATNENRAMNCVDWYVAFAFCAWDGGRLPTEAEWEYAAAGGAADRLLPWGASPAPDCTHLAMGGCTSGVSDVGAFPLGVGLFGQHDLAGNVYEWNLDEFDAYSTAACNDCANLAFTTRRSFRGGAFNDFDLGFFRSAYRESTTPDLHAEKSLGFRCARAP